MSGMEQRRLSRLLAGSTGWHSKLDRQQNDVFRTLELRDKRCCVNALVILHQYCQTPDAPDVPVAIHESHGFRRVALGVEASSGAGEALTTYGTETLPTRGPTSATQNFRISVFRPPTPLPYISRWPQESPAPQGARTCSPVPGGTAWHMSLRTRLHRTTNGYRHRDRP